MATEYGARSLGYENLGALREGYLADFIVLDDLFLTPLTESNLFEQLIVHGKQEYVSDVFVNGRQLMDRHGLLTLDEEKAYREVRDIAERFWKGL